jgi:Tol biopolymer transport system component
MLNVKTLFSFRSVIVSAVLSVSGLFALSGNAIIETGSGQTEPSVDVITPGNKLLKLNGPYLGQDVPGMKARLFAPGIVSVTGRYEFALSFAPKGDRLLFTVQTADEKVMVLHSRQVEGQWTQPKPVGLSNGERRDEMEAFFTPDGHHVYFAPYDEGMDVRIWQVTPDGDLWRDPVPLAGAIAEHPAFYPVMANDGTLYYTNIKEQRPYFARQSEDGNWNTQPVPVEFGGHVHVAPDQSFLLLDARAEDSLGGGDIYVAFPATNGGWTRPVNLGPGVNSEFGESCPSLSADGKYLFFSRYNEEGGIAQIYWVNAGVIALASKQARKDTR